MYLKSLTLRGFKSFASSTTLRFEPGITCVVGPERLGQVQRRRRARLGDGRAGRQVAARRQDGGRHLRRHGRAGRRSGRAEVVLTIDNTDGALPIDYAEVTISRTMFKGGGSEYAINGQTCRLLDVQELLSDSGIGREMHVIVGQGQLDAILHATPEDRRGFVEEAAGVLKHRKRKEKALRKLEATDGNLTRLDDLLGEIRRQLKPLGRQAEVARRAVQVQADLRDAGPGCSPTTWYRARRPWTRSWPTRPRCASSGPRSRPRPGGRPGAGDRRSTRRCAPTRRGWPGRRRPGTTCPGCASGSPAPRAWRPSGSALANEPRRRAPRRPRPRRAGRRGAPGPRAGAPARRRAGRGAATTLETAVGTRQSAEQAHAEEERRVAGLTRAAADRREGLARLHGQVHALRTRATAAEEEIGRLTAGRAEALARAERAQHDFTALENQRRRAGRRRGRPGRDARGAPRAQLDDLEPTAGQAARGGAGRRARAGGAGRAQGGARARAGAQGRRGRAAGGDRAGLRPARVGRRAADRAAGLRGRGRGRAGQRGRRGRRRRRRLAVAAVELLRGDDLGRPGCVLGVRPAHEPPRRLRRTAPGDLPARAVAGARRRRRAARRCAPRSAPCSAATVRGRDAGRGPRGRRRPARAAGGHDRTATCSAGCAPPAARRRRRACSRCRRRSTTRGARLAEATHAASGCASTWPGSRRSAPTRRAGPTPRWPSCTSPTPRWPPSPSSSAISVLRPGRRTPRPSGSSAPSPRPSRRATATSPGWPSWRPGSAPPRTHPTRSPTTRELERLVDGARTARPGRDGGPAGAAHGRGAGPCAGRPGRAARAGRRGRAVGAGAGARPPRAAPPRGGDRPRGRAPRSQRCWPGWSARWPPPRPSATAVEQARAERERRSPRSAAEVRALDAELAGLTDSVHRDEVARAEQRLRIEALEQRALEELGLDPETLVAEYGPDVPGRRCPAMTRRPTTADGGRRGGPRRNPSRCRTTATSRTSGCAPPSARSRCSGRVNPLALEEFAALEERHAFLTEQLEDLKRTRRDLLEIIGEVDDAGAAGVLRGLRRRRARVRGRVRPAVPRRRGAAGAHRPRRPAHDRHRRRGPAGGQEGQAAVAAVRRRAVAGGGGVPGRDVQGPARARSTSSTRSRRRSTTPTSAGCSRSTRSCARPASCSSSPTRSARWRSATRSTASRCAATGSRP